MTDVIIDVQKTIDSVATTTPMLQEEEPAKPETSSENSPEGPVPSVDISSHPTLKQICSCESGNGKYGTPNQFEPDGVTPLVGKLTPARLGQDIGMCQINTMYHLETATSLGFDIYTEAGNWGYATYLYEIQGVAPWEASRSCWQ